MQRLRERGQERIAALVPSWRGRGREPGRTPQTPPAGFHKALESTHTSGAAEECWGPSSGPNQFATRSYSSSWLHGLQVGFPVGELWTDASCPLWTVWFYTNSPNYHNMIEDFQGVLNKIRLNHIMSFLPLTRITQSLFEYSLCLFVLFMSHWLLKLNFDSAQHPVKCLILSLLLDKILSCSVKSPGSPG